MAQIENGGQGPLDPLEKTQVVEQLEHLLEAAKALLATVTLVRGKMPEDEDKHGHEKWAMDDLARAAEAAESFLGEDGA